MTTLHAPPRGPILTSTQVALLIQPSVGVSANLIGLLEPRGFEVRIARDFPTVLPTGALVVVEADRGARAVGLAKHLHSLNPDAPIVCVLPWWDDDEAEAGRVCRFILHVPMRDDELQRLVRFVEDLVPRTAAV